MQMHHFIAFFLVLPWLSVSQISNSYRNQHDAAVARGKLSYEESAFLLKPTSQSINAQTSSPPAQIVNYLIGNLSQAYSFQVAPSTTKVSYLGWNGIPLYFSDSGLRNKSAFTFDEQSNRLTIVSLDTATVGSYLASVVHQTTMFITVIRAINVSSLEIHNAHVTENDNASFLSCSVAILRSTYESFAPFLAENNQLQKSQGAENLPRINLFLPSRSLSPTVFDKKVYNDTFNEKYVIRRVTLQRPLRRADHNDTVQCQVESDNGDTVYLTKSASINVEYGPYLETGALSTVSLAGEVLKPLDMVCTIEANPAPSYIWYEVSRNISVGMATDYNQLSPYEELSTNRQTVFGTTRKISKMYEYPGQYVMQCQAQSRGKTVQQDFIISVGLHKDIVNAHLNSNVDRAASSNPLLIALIACGVLVMLVILTIASTMLFSKRRFLKSKEKDSSTEKLSNDKPSKPRWGNLPIDYAKRQLESLKTDSSSVSHLVESIETASIQAPPAVAPTPQPPQPPPVPARPSPMITAHSPYRPTPLTLVSLSYRQASALPGFRPTLPSHSYSSDRDEVDDISTSINGVPVRLNRSRTNTPLGSHKSLSESIQSLRSNQQAGFSLPVKKRLPDPPSAPPKRERKTPSPDSSQAKNEYQHHHYHNPAQLRAQQELKTDDTSSEEEEFDEQRHHQQQMNKTSENSLTTASTTVSSGYNQVDFHSESAKRAKPPMMYQQTIPKPTETGREEVPPSYLEATNTSSPSRAYVYQEPTEV